MIRKLFNLLFLFFSALVSYAQQKIPSSYSNIHYNNAGQLFFQKGGERYYADTTTAIFGIAGMLGYPVTTQDGIILDFGSLKGMVSYGFIPYGKSLLPTTAFRFTTPLQEGKAVINIKENFLTEDDNADMNGNKGLSIGYRVQDEKGIMLYDGVISVTGTGPFSIQPTLYEGPFVSNITDSSTVIWYETNVPVKSFVTVSDKKYSDSVEVTHHEILVKGLKPGVEYKYEVRYGTLSQNYSFKTAPLRGARKPFVFAFTSDSRQGAGGGERNFYGVNFYIMKKVAALSYQHNAAFLQFTGDLVSGYKTNQEELLLQLANWKKSVEPFWHYMPFYVAQGNHESLGYLFRNTAGKQEAFIDKFPFETESAEAIMQQAFVNPTNGPDSEDGNKYDIDKNNTGFPSYKENVFYYTYDNVAMIVLNSSYWYASNANTENATSGGLFGYLLDNQLNWLRQVIKKLENDKNIDHVFVTLHTPVFPNGGHVGDAMWYNGNNEKRPYISGKPVEKGIIERRDEFLNILINESKKVVAILSGHEHNYNRMQITNELPIYPADYPYSKLKITRPIYQIINGASGAPYYLQSTTPWINHVKAFTVENALCLFYVEGKSIKMKTINPDTLNVIDEVQLR